MEGVIYWSVLQGDFSLEIKEGSRAVFAVYYYDEDMVDEARHQHLTLEDVREESRGNALFLIGKSAGWEYMIDVATDTGWLAYRGEICPHCHQTIPFVEGRNFCSSCGHPLDPIATKAEDK